MIPVLSILLISCYLGFYYVFAVDMKAVLLSISYMAAGIVIPGYICTRLLFMWFSNDSKDEYSWDTVFPLLTILGIANILISYLAATMLDNPNLNYLFVWPFAALVFSPFRRYLSSSLHRDFHAIIRMNITSAAIMLFFILAVSILFFLSRPTPGILPLDLFHDHVWNAGNVVSLVSEFPLRSMNVETQPFISYHILVHIVAAHMAIITGLVPHLAGLQYVFIPVIILLILNTCALLSHFINREQKTYLFYGLAVILFGGGFTIVHEVKVNSLLNSNTNILGVTILFAFAAVMINSEKYNKKGNFLMAFIGAFLVTGAKGSIGASIFAGMVLWAAYKIWITRGLSFDKSLPSGAVAGFIAAYIFFFILPVHNQAVVETATSDGFGGYFFPFSYITKNAMARPFLDVIYKYIPSQFQAVSHILLIACLLPFNILLYFSYRLIVIGRLKSILADEREQKIFFIIMGSIIITYLVDKDPQDHAYFAAAGLFLLDMFFVRHLFNKKIITFIKDSFRNREFYTVTGGVLLLVLPFLGLNGWVKKDYAYNFFMYGKIGKAMDARFSKTEYRQKHTSITPEYYAALQYIRQNSDKNATIITPCVELENGKPLAFYTSAFGERPVYLEGYSFGGIKKYIGQTEIDRRLKIINDIYNKDTVPAELMDGRYIFLTEIGTMNRLSERYNNLKILYKNNHWCAFNILHGI